MSTEQTTHDPRGMAPRVMLLCSDLEVGGLQRVTVNLARGLTALGLDISCAVLRRGGDFRTLLPPSVSLTELGCTSQPLALLLPNSKLARHLREARPDVVISLGHTVNLLAAWAKVLRRCPFRLIASEHSTLSARIAGRALQRWRRLARARLLYRQAEAVVCVSHGVAEDLISLGVVPPEKARVIYNPIVDDLIVKRACKPAPNLLGRAWTQPGEPPVLLAAGRLIPLKEYDMLLRAFHILRMERGVEARLIFIGEGPERGRLETLASELGVRKHVLFAGLQRNPYAWMSKAACLALSARFEGFANVLVEAMACGTNVVSTDCPSGPSEILEGGRWGRLVPVGDVQAMARAVEATLRRPLPSSELVEAAARFSVARSASEWRELILNRG